MPQAPSLGTEIVKRVAAQEEVDPLDLDPCLFDAIDPEALERIVAGTAGALKVEFTYHGYAITVDERGTVSLGAGPSAPSEDGHSTVADTSGHN